MAARFLQLRLLTGLALRKMIFRSVECDPSAAALDGGQHLFLGNRYGDSDPVRLRSHQAANSRGKSFDRFSGGARLFHNRTLAARKPGEFLSEFAPGRSGVHKMLCGPNLYAVPEIICLGLRGAGARWAIFPEPESNDSFNSSAATNVNSPRESTSWARFAHVDVIRWDEQGRAIRIDCPDRVRRTGSRHFIRVGGLVGCVP